MFVPLACIAVISSAAQAQIVPDRTLGDRGSVVTPDIIKGIPSDRIDEGAIRGTNLFHSFQEFNVNEGRGAYFSNPAGIENILSRVTGGNASQILGTLGVLGNANLFLINPNGIVFGPNARLDVAGSFFASTADSLVFENGFEFSATNPQAPPLLTVNIPIGLQFRASPGSIVNRSTARDNTSQIVGLQVPSSQTLGLIGSKVNIEAGHLTAVDGRIELGSLAGNSLVNLTPTKTAYTLGYEGVKGFQDIQLSQGAFVSTSGNSGGSIQVQGRNVTLSDGARLSTSTQGNGKGGTVTIRASESVVFEGESPTGYQSGVFSLVEPLARGDAGGIEIDTASLSLKDGATVYASTQGNGKGGTVTIRASESVAFEGESPTGNQRSGVFSLVEPSARGDAGGIEIDTASLSLKDGATVYAGIQGQEGGKGNTVTIRASESVVFEGESPTGDQSGVFSIVERLATGNAGGIEIDTASFSLKDGATVYASTQGNGKGGTVTIRASGSTTIEGESPTGDQRSGVFSVVEPLAKGDAGGINIEASSLTLKDGAILSTSTEGEGKGGTVNIRASESVVLDGESPTGALSSVLSVTEGSQEAGKIEIETASLTLKDGARLAASTFGSGRGGTVNIRASESVLFEGISSSGLLNGVESLVEQRASGDAGEIKIDTASLTLRNGGYLTTSTSGEGNAGTVKIHASESVVFEGEFIQGNFGLGVGGISSIVESGASGDAGEIEIDAASFNLTDGAFLSTSTLGESDAGSITVTANTFEITAGARLLSTTRGNGAAGDIVLKVQNSITLAGKNSGILANTDAGATGNGGSIVIDPATMIIRDGAKVAVDSQGSGVGGNIQLEAGSLTLDRGTLTAETTSNQGGNIYLLLKDLLLLSNGSNITATAGTESGEEDGGNIDIDAQFVIAFPNEDSNITANAFKGKGGAVNITTDRIFGLEFRDRETPFTNDITASSEFGVDGTVLINTLEVDPTAGLVELPTTFVDEEGLIAQNPCKKGFESEFIITGRGGVPLSPNQALSSEATGVGLVEPAPMSSPSILPAEAGERTSSTPSTPKLITAAQGWVFNALGEVVLTAYNPSVTGPQRLQRNSGSCPVP
jgi:filamentous hemagglutinin family protein